MVEAIPVTGQHPSRDVEGVTPPALNSYRPCDRRMVPELRRVDLLPHVGRNRKRDRRPLRVPLLTPCHDPSEDLQSEQYRSTK